VLLCSRDTGLGKSFVWGAHPPQKIAPDLDEAQIEDIAHVVKSVEMDGIIATNTTIARDGMGLTSDMTKVKEIGAGGPPPGTRRTSLARLLSPRRRLGRTVPP